MHLRADVGGHRQLLHLDLAATAPPRHGRRRRSSLRSRAPATRRRRRPCPRPSAVAWCRSRPCPSPRAACCAAAARRRHCCPCRRAARCGTAPGSLPAACASLVDHAFDRPEGPARRDRPQLARRGGVVRHLVLDRPHIVIGHGVEEVRAVHGEGVERPLLVDRGRQEIGDAPALRSARPDHVMVERDQLAVGVEARLDLLVGERPREIHGHVVFARIDHLDRLADGLRRLHRRHHHVGVETPAEAAAQPHLVHHDEFGIDPGRTRRDRAGARRELVAGIDVPGCRP